MRKKVSYAEFCLRHGYDLRVYNAWKDMRKRCTNRNQPQWKDWGGRGITICARWNSYENFAADMGPHPGKGWSLDRINNDGDYEPGNCRWANWKVQGRNRNYVRLSPLLAAEIRAKYVPRINQYYPGYGGIELAKEYGVGRTTIYHVLRGRHWQ